MGRSVEWERNLAFPLLSFCLSALSECSIPGTPAIQPKVNPTNLLSPTSQEG